MLGQMIQTIVLDLLTVVFALLGSLFVSKYYCLI